MTDRVKGFTVVLEENVRVDDAETIVTALRMVKGVVSVLPIIADSGDIIIASRTRHKIIGQIYDLIARL